MIKILYLNNEKICFDLNNMKVIGEGKEGIVYKYNDDCIKLFHNNRNSGDLLSINEDKFIFFTQLNTQRIILPKKLLYNYNGEIAGYLMKYIESDFKLNNIRNKNIDDIIEYLGDLKKDIDILNDNDVLINDLKNSHLLYNSGFYLIDTSLYSKYQYDNVLNYNVKSKNISSVNQFFIGLLLMQKESIKDYSLNNRNIPNVYCKLHNDNFYFIADILEKESKKYKVNDLNELRLIYKKGLNSLKNK